MADTLVMPTNRMPIGNDIQLPIRSSDIEITEGNEAPAQFNDDAAATLVWQNYQTAKNYVENSAWLLEWQHTDILYQSPTLDLYTRNEGGRPARISRFIVAKNTNTMARSVKRALFAQQLPFFLRPKGKATQKMTDAWTAILGALLKRMNFKYHVGLLIDCQTLQGTGIGKMGWDERTIIKKRRKRKGSPVNVDLPVGGTKEVATAESDQFDVIEEEVTESWPFFEYRRLGTTLFDPKCSTPNRPDLSGTYSIDVDYVTFTDLQEMRKLDCYKNIPSDEVLKEFFLTQPVSDARPGSQIEDDFSAQGSAVTHAEGRNKQTDENPLEKPLLLLEQWDDRTVMALLEYDGRKLIIRNEEHNLGRDPHVTGNWWSQDNCLYGIGIGRLNGGDQRVHQGVLNERLKMIAYPMNAPIVVARGENAPTQNVINRLATFWPVDLPPGVNDVQRAVAFLPMPNVPTDAWKMLDYSMQSAEDVSGANSTMMQGNLGGPGSSAARTATGASRIAGQADANISDPVDNIAEGVIVPVIEFLIEMVKERMPLSEIRDILSEADAKIILTAVQEEQFLNAEFQIDVLAGQRLQAKSGIQQLIPIFLQMLQQPQLLEYLHQRGETVDFAVMIDLMMQVAELQGQEDIIRPLTQQETASIQALNPNAQRGQTAIQVEQLRGQNKIQEVHAKAQDDLANKAAEVALEKTADGIPFERATGLVERGQDENFLKGQTTV
jgi:hypothetical protein